jgi:hypothetical protein
VSQRSKGTDPSPVRDRFEWPPTAAPGRRAAHAAIRTRTPAIERRTSPTWRARPTFVVFIASEVFVFSKAFVIFVPFVASATFVSFVA